MTRSFIPQEITRAGDDIKIIWQDGKQDVYPSRDLRLRCKCAQCVEEMTGRPLLDPRTVPEDVKPVNIQLVGRYGLQVWWSDGHSTGIYTFRRLREIAEEAEKS